MKIKALLLLILLLSASLYLRLPSIKNLDKPYGELVWKHNQSHLFNLGKYQISVDSNQKTLVVLSNSKVVWLTQPGKAFLNASHGSYSAEEHRGMFQFEFQDIKNCSDQILRNVEEVDQKIVISGQLDCSGDLRGWSLHLSENKNQDLDVKVEVDSSLDRAFIRFNSHLNEGLIGAGEQFTHFDLKGHIVPIWVSEQGIGRGAQPLTTLVDIAAGAGGHALTTYASSGQFVTTDMRGFYIQNTEYGELDFSNKDFIGFDFWSNKLNFTLTHAKTPKELLTQLSEYTGRMRMLPDWIHRGAVIGMQGGTNKVKDVMKRLFDSEAIVSGFWLQDWVGQRKTSFGKQLWWNWELDRTHYPDWDEIVAELQDKDIRVMGYINPFLTELHLNHPHKRHLRKEAVEKGYLVKDKNGNVLDILNTSFSAALIDLSNNEARKWVKEIIKSELIGSGLSGWMADFAEALPLDTQISNGDPKSFHNYYPVEWAKLNREVIDELDNSNEYVFFTRAGFTESPRYSTLFWTGDQMVTWDKYDGLKSSLTGILTGGMSGISLNHSDVGGYTSLKRFGLSYLRTKELFIRWMELNAFSPVFRTHEGNLPDESLQIYNDPEIWDAFVKNSKLFASLFEYRKKLIKESAEKGWPVMRPMWFEFPDEKETLKNDDQFMMGSEILVAPVMQPGKESVHVFFPKGQWRHLITEEEFDIEKSQWREIKAALGTPAAFRLMN